MDFTREPVIETIITPREGYKLVVRCSKGSGQEEHFVDAVEMVTFGSALFFRSLERPKCFLLPVSDYEVLETREARMIFKNVAIERAIKIGGGREAPLKAKEPLPIKIEEPALDSSEGIVVKEDPAAFDSRLERKRERRRHYRRRRGRDETTKEGWEGESAEEEGLLAEEVKLDEAKESLPLNQEVAELTSAPLNTILPPPPTLIRETISRYKNSDLFKNAFYERSEEEQEKGEAPQPLAENENREDSAAAHGGFFLDEAEASRMDSCFEEGALKDASAVQEGDEAVKDLLQFAEEEPLAYQAHRQSSFSFVETNKHPHLLNLISENQESEELKQEESPKEPSPSSLAQTSAETQPELFDVKPLSAHLPQNELQADELQADESKAETLEEKKKEENEPTSSHLSSEPVENKHSEDKETSSGR